MDNKILAPVLAGIGIGWLAFSKEGQQMAKGLGQSIMPALGGGKNGGGQESESKQLGEGDDKEKSSPGKEDDE